MTPYEFSILLHYHVRCDEYDDLGAPAFPDTFQWLIECGLLAKRHVVSAHGSSYETTDKGRFWLDAALNTPLPEQRWVIPAPLPRSPPHDL